MKKITNPKTTIQLHVRQAIPVQVQLYMALILASRVVQYLISLIRNVKRQSISCDCTGRFASYMDENDVDSFFFSLCGSNHDVCYYRIICPHYTHGTMFH